MIDWNPNLIKKMRLKEGNKLIVFDQEKVHTSSPIGGVIFTDKISEAEGILFLRIRLPLSNLIFQKYLNRFVKKVFYGLHIPKNLQEQKRI